MLIEFIGLPGSGKSTLANDLEKTMTASRAILLSRQLDESRIERIGKLFHLYNFPLFLIKCGLVFCLLRRPSAVKRAIKLYFFHLKLQSRSDRSIALLDQGGCQYIWSLWTRVEGRGVDVAKILAQVYGGTPPSILIYVNVSPVEASRRLGVRNSNCNGNPTGFDNLSERDRSVVFQSSLLVINIIKDCFSEAGVNVYDIHNGAGDEGKSYRYVFNEVVHAL